MWANIITLGCRIQNKFDSDTNTLGLQYWMKESVSQNQCTIVNQAILQIMYIYTCVTLWSLYFSFVLYGRDNILQGPGNSIMVSVFICHAGHPGSRPVRSVCFRKVKCYQNVINFSPPVLTTPKAVHVLLCLCNNACKRSLAICLSRASCPVSRLLSVPIQPAYAEQGR